MYPNAQMQKAEKQWKSINTFLVLEKISESLKPKTIVFEHYSINKETKLSKKKDGDSKDEENASHYTGSGRENTNSDDEDERPKRNHGR
ncbi:hypothetical protein AZE42_13256 [Rhizopogon vesiculosus]|uniref:Uncharacterized protein n=1 Tax=Rhizopogon vesiculosus TaxID=180088 RepID=A0A1J8Q532_9AGAM|nr:hypothetical protein AZE42_13256 [Rhizopogon vesiculosus]